MQYDDRLATVLRPKVTGAASARIQYHQLLDLLGTSPAEARGDLLDAGYQRLAELSAQLPVQDRVAALAEPALRLRSARLVAVLAGGEPAVAGAAVRAARLSDEQWLDLIPALPPSARAAVGGRRDIGAGARASLARLGIGDQALPPVETAQTAVATGEPAVVKETPPAAPEPISEPAGPEGIGAIVRRIDAFRRARDEAAAPAPTGDSPRLPLGEAAVRTTPDIRSFDFVADGAGRISWSEPRVAPMVVGIELGELPGLYAAIRQHQPIRAAAVTLAGAPAIAGAWQVDASPSFAPQGGRFVGHLGRFRRRAAEPAADAPTPEADRLRQVLHELRTPVNAIQGFAEIIQQQLFGATPHEYRALAAVIAADAARMLAGFEELERFAQLDGMALSPGESDLVACVAATIDRLKPHTAPRASGFVLAAPDGPLPLAIASIEIERLCWRLLATLAGNAGASEVLRLDLRSSARQAQLSAQLPAALAHLDDDALLHAGAGPGEQTLSAGMFGTGFALRLAASEAAAAGGRLERAEQKLNLFLPLSRPAQTHASDVQAS